MPLPTRHLVIVRAGDGSLHQEWTTSLATRNWDLVVSYWGDDPHCYRGEGQRRIDDKGPKWPGLYALLTREDFWRAYDYVWLPEDDLRTRQSSIERLFELSDELDLELSQPSLSWESYYSHYVTLHSPSFLARFSEFIEVMAPCFRRQFLEACLPTLGDTQSGWGMDWVWPRLQTRGIRGCAILDDVQITHTRPVGGPLYATLKTLGVSAPDECERTLRKYGIESRSSLNIDIAIDRGGRLLDARIPGDRDRLVALLTTDAGAILSAKHAFDLDSQSRISIPATRRWGR
jgi:hypothetical protein